MQEAADQGASHPDMALYTARQVQRGRPRPGQIPERGVVEVKGVGDDVWAAARSDQVARYRDRYGLVLVTTLRDFVLVGTGDASVAVTGASATHAAAAHAATTRDHSTQAEKTP